MNYDFKNLKSFLINEGFKGVSVIGDVHGEPEPFNNKIKEAKEKNYFIVSLGDIVDYGPDSITCIELMHKIIMNRQGIMIIGNHERKLKKYFEQNDEGEIRIQITGGLKKTVEQLNKLDSSRYEHIKNLFHEIIEHSRHHLILGDYLFVHGSATPEMWDNYDAKLKGKQESRALFGQTDPNKKFNDDGFPNRIYDWVDDIPKGKTVIVGHDIRNTKEPLIQYGSLGGKAIFLDTGCGKDGILSSYEIKF